MRKGLCLNCGKPGHFAASCNLPRNDKGRAMQDESTEKGRVAQENSPKPSNNDNATQWGPYFPEEPLNA